MIHRRTYMVDLLYKRLLHAKCQTWSCSLLLEVINAAPVASGGITALQALQSEVISILHRCSSKMALK
jgi:hypothetical protein